MALTMIRDLSLVNVSPLRGWGFKSIRVPTACAVGYRSSAAPRLGEHFHFRTLNARPLLRLRQRHAADRVFADTSKVEHALVLDHVGYLRETLR